VFLLLLMTWSMNLEQVFLALPWFEIRCS
jgi:hypothetical protein